MRQVNIMTCIKKNNRRYKKICPECGKVNMTTNRYCSKACRLTAKEKKTILSGQLCWSCKNTNGNVCSWFSKKSEPVEGWTAKPTIIRNNEEIVRSYRVIKCPNYEQGRIR